MRMRKKKHGAERLDSCSEFLIKNIEAPIESPAELLNMPNAEIWLEIGAGKGGFATKMAKKNPDVAYIALEKVTDCIVLAAEGAKREFREEKSNLRFINDTADNLTKIFNTGTVSRIFLNFSDPWTKKGYAKRRLTHSRYLAVYFNLLKDGGKLRFKTDNTALFDFSLEEFEKMGLAPDVVTRDLHASEYARDNIMTEYETAFSSRGIKINMLEVTKPQGFLPDIPEELSRDRKSYG